MRCYACRTTIKARDRFCAGCGAPARQRFPAAAPASELKYVTLLRADLVDSTGLVAGLGPEAVLARLEPPLAAMRDAVRRFGGIVAKELGDGLLAAFGAPVADDNHAVLACHAALDLLRGLDRLGDARLQVRIGLHSGLVVARVTATEFSSVYDLGGPALILVERLQAAAQPGRIYASEACRKLAEGAVDFDSLPPTPLKGFPEPVTMHRVAAISDLSRWRVRAARGATRFVGRGSEMQVLARAAETALQSKGQAVLLTGEPGVGKSRLTHEFLRDLEGKGWRAIEAACSPTAQTTPYALLKSLLRAAGSQESAALPPLWRAARDSVLDLPVADPAWHALAPAQRGRAIAEACRAIVEGIVQEHPTLLLIEDLHWIDDASNAALDALTSLSDRHPLLILFTSRPQAAPDWIGRCNATRLWLRPLDDRAAQDLLDALLDRSITSLTLKQRLLRHTGGVPLFIEEVCRQLIETKALPQDGRAATLDKTFDELGVPPTIQGVIAARIDRLAKPDRALLQIASAIGPRAAVAALRAVAAMSDRQLRERLKALGAAGLLVESCARPDPVYAFPHDLMRQITYEAMLEPTRLRLHRDILAAFEAAAPAQAEDQSATLCYHAVRAQDWPKTYLYARAMAQKCLARSALSDAAAYFESAIEALDRTAASTEREEKAIDLRLEARLAFSGLGRADRWPELARQAEERAAAIGDGPRRIAAMVVRAIALNFYGKPPEAIVAGEHALHLAEQMNDLGWLNYAIYVLGQAYFIAGRCREAEQMLARAYEQLAGPDPRAPSGMSVRGLSLLCCMMKSAAHVALGELDSADFFQRRAQDSADLDRRPYNQVAAGYSSGMFLLCRGDLNEAKTRLEQALAVARQHEVRQFIPIIACQLGLAQIELGLFEAARDILAEAKTEAESMGNGSAALRNAVYLALARSECGEIEPALQMVRDARKSAQQQGFTGLEAEALFTEAKISATAAGHDDRTSLDLLRRSIAIACRIEARPQLAKSKALLGVILAKRRKARGPAQNRGGEEYAATIALRRPDCDILRIHSEPYPAND